MTHHCHKDYPDYWSPRLARSHYCQQWILPVRLSVCHAPSNCFFFFVSRWNRAIFWPSVLHVALYKILVLDFWFMPPNAQNLLPKICTKSQIAYKSACMADTPQMFGPTRGFSGMADSMEPCKMLWRRPLLPRQRNFGKCGLFLHKIAYKSACMPDIPDVFWPTRRADQGADPCWHGNDNCARRGV